MTEKQDRFSHAMEQCRQAYRDIPTPPELEGAVEDAIQAGCRPRLPRRGLKRAAAAAAGLCACFVVLTSPAVAAAVELGLCDAGKDVTVKLAGGDLTVNYTRERVLLTGSAAMVYQGEFEY